MMSDEELLRDTRPASELRRGLLAESIIRMAYLRGLGRLRRVGEAVEAIAADQARCAAPDAMIHEYRAAA